MQALIVIDVQNEFSSVGERPVPAQEATLTAIQQQVDYARDNKIPIAWVRHFNQPHESPAFVPGTWGAEFSSGFGPLTGSEAETEFQKNVYGAFTGSDIGSWLQSKNIDEVTIVGFYTHGCVSTTAREAIMAGYNVVVDPLATATCSITHELLGMQTADEVHRAALLHLFNMGVAIRPFKAQPVLTHVQEA